MKEDVRKQPWNSIVQSLLYNVIFVMSVFYLPFYVVVALLAVLTILYALVWIPIAIATVALAKNLKIGHIQRNWTPLSDFICIITAFTSTAALLIMGYQMALFYYIAINLIHLGVIVIGRRITRNLHVE